MAFNRQKTDELSTHRDRDATPFFAGRADEIDQFDRALTELVSQPGDQAVFRIYQGAPGCGKTALLHHLRETRADEVFFVSVQERHLSSETALMERIRQVAIEEGRIGRRIVARALQTLGSHLRVGEATEVLSDAIAEGGTDRIALFVDEAQSVGPSERPGLAALHREGIGIPTVCLFTGLGHTANRFRQIEGLSRLAANAIVNMGAMAESECAESTRNMLGSLGAKGDREHSAQVVAKLSLGWPQHLKGAQTALCRELLRTNGELGEVDYERLRTESDSNRHGYYNARLAGSILGIHRPFTATVVAAIQRQQPVDPGDLIGLCENRLAGSQPTYPGLKSATGEAFADALIERGVLSPRSDERYEVAIPSMAEWLAGLVPRASPG
ncbi:MAG: hypothetical protein OXQ90_16625 [Gammaproteobacteria bacterium]|nr:hypothetical protein [Gammaproteobacteria bacterium]